jgi:broad specificity phosphatase PhoE
LRARIAPCLERILAENAGRQVAVICHGGVIRMALSILFGFSLPEMACFEVEYASVTRVVWIANQPRLEVANFTPWRDLAP